MGQRPWPVRLAGYILLWIAGLLPHILQWEYRGLLLTAAWAALALGFFALASHVVPWAAGGRLGSLGLCRHPGFARNLVIGILFGLLLTSANYLIRWELGRFTIASVLPLRLAVPALLWALLNSLYSAAWEEVLNRGYLVRVLPAARISVVALLSSSIFAAFHITKWGAPLHSWVFWFCSGLLLVTPYLITGSLWFSLGLHWGQNFLVFALFERGGLFEVVWHTGHPWLYNFTNTGVVLLLLPVVWWVSRRWLARAHG